MKNFSLYFLFSLVAIFFAWFWKGPISGRGGLPFPGCLEISVPQLFQADPRWGNEPLGTSPPDTIARTGCAISSAAMVLAFYGVKLTPQELNLYLISHDGYEGTSWVKWEVAVTYPPGIAEHIYEDLPSYGLIDWNLLQGNPVVVRIRKPNGTNHFVVIVGKRGFNYLIRDPAPAGVKGVYPLREVGAPIDALRYFKKITTNVVQAGRNSPQGTQRYTKEHKKRIFIKIL